MKKALAFAVFLPLMFTGVAHSIDDLVDCDEALSSNGGLAAPVTPERHFTSKVAILPQRSGEKRVRAIQLVGNQYNKSWLIPLEGDLQTGRFKVVGPAVETHEDFTLGRALPDGRMVSAGLVQRNWSEIPFWLDTQAGKDDRFELAFRRSPIRQGLLSMDTASAGYRGIKKTKKGTLVLVEKAEHVELPSGSWALPLRKEDSSFSQVMSQGFSQTAAFLMDGLTLAVLTVDAPQWSQAVKQSVQVLGYNETARQWGLIQEIPIGAAPRAVGKPFVSRIMSDSRGSGLLGIQRATKSRLLRWEIGSKAAPLFWPATPSTHPLVITQLQASPATGQVIFIAGEAQKKRGEYQWRVHVLDERTLKPLQAWNLPSQRQEFSENEEDGESHPEFDDAESPWKGHVDPSGQYLALFREGVDRRVDFGVLNLQTGIWVKRMTRTEWVDSTPIFWARVEGKTSGLWFQRYEDADINGAMRWVSLTK